MPSANAVIPVLVDESQRLGSSQTYLSRAAAARAGHCLETRVVGRAENPRKPGFFRDVTEQSHVPKPGTYDVAKCRSVECPNCAECAFDKAQATAEAVSSEEMAEAAVA